MRSRVFASIIYLESAINDWISILESFNVPAFVSPLHDKDINKETGEVKKAHYHILLMYDGCKTEEQVKEVLNAVGAVGIERVQSVRAYARYLCHLDSVDESKVKYDVSDVISLCGANYFKYLEDAENRYEMISEMIDFCESNNIISYSKLIVYAKNERYDWFKCLCDGGTPVIKEYLKSYAWTNNLEKKG